MEEYILKLEAVDRGSIHLAGGKAALLGELLALGYPVPGGFVITAAAYDDFIERSGIHEKIAAFRQLTNENEIQQAADAIAAAVEEAPLPADLAVGLSSLYRSLGQRPRVAVRPSPRFHDTIRNPIAGKLEHFLNVVGEKDLFQAIRNLWSGIWDPVIISFFRRRTLDHDLLKPAAIVQAMVRPISSGTIFTADPVTGERDKLLITAGWGMKQESISGRVMPDTYHVDRETLTLRYKRIVTKELMVSASGLVPVPKNRKNAVVLKDAAIRDLCQMATGIEDVFGKPAEVEWCVLQGGAFQVLEAMPIVFEDEAARSAAKPRAVTTATPDSAPDRETDEAPAAPDDADAAQEAPDSRTGTDAADEAPDSRASTDEAEDTAATRTGTDAAEEAPATRTGTDAAEEAPATNNGTDEPEEAPASVSSDPDAAERDPGLN